MKSLKLAKALIQEQGGVVDTGRDLARLAKEEPPYTEIARQAEARGFTLGRARRSGTYPIAWTKDGQNYHQFLRSLNVVMPFIERIEAEHETGGAE